MRMIASLVFLLLLSGLALNAQESSGTVAAKAEFDKGEAFRQKMQYPQAVEHYRKAIDLDPNYVDAHSSFIFISKQTVYTSIDNDAPDRSAKIQVAEVQVKNDLLKVYEELVKTSPNVPAYQWALSEIYMNHDYDKVEEYASNAVKLDPKFGRAYQTLALLYDVKGDEVKRLAFLKKAAESQPGNASYAFYYSNALRRSNLKLFRETALDMAKRFPGTDRGAQSLYWLADTLPDVNEKIAIYNQLKSSFPPSKFSWSSSGMSSLFDLYAKSDLIKATSLANEMSEVATSDRDKKSWQARHKAFQELIVARQRIKEGKFSEANAALEKTLTIANPNRSPILLAKAEALDGMGQTEAAYQLLLGVMASVPSDTFKSAFTKYGTKLKKTEGEINSDVLGKLEARAKPVKDFTLTRYGTEKPVTLSDYRGKVVLLNFWYPFCGPCRGENPELQKILKKYGDKFVILAVNAHPEEDKFVLPYIRGNKFDFIPLRGSREFAEKEFGVGGMPANFLIDQTGRILYTPGVVRGEAARSLELQIETLLQR